MIYRETTIRVPHEAGRHRGDTPVDPRVSVSLPAEGFEVTLFFAEYGGGGDVLEARIVPKSSPLSPAKLKRLVARWTAIVDYARATMQDEEKLKAALGTLRAAGRTSRGLDPDFYRLLSRQYETLVAKGEPSPITALATQNNATVSAASRWVKEARRRGLLAT